MSMDEVSTKHEPQAVRVGWDLRQGEFTYADRTDDVETKVRLLRQAQQDGNFALAIALADSIKDTLQCEQMLREDPGAPVVPASAWGSVGELPASWESWAAGWSLFQVLALDEPIGQPRRGEPVDVLIALPADRVAAPAREVRVARVDAATGTLREVRSQLYNEVRRGGQWLARLVVLADVPARGRSVYLVFCGNPAAELPDYPSELRVHGEGFGLDIETAHYVARLSRQMGQLERLTSKHRHGLELYAGGEGHGEPPNIDWAHDYLASGKFQKFRVTNWESCPNYEVVRGPLCTIVRRFGFPHSPAHPLFTPSRLFIDVSYTFYGDLPYLLKDGRMDAAQDFTLNYSRDDEWVFSGYSFTDSLWMDEQWRLHEGPVPREHADRLWGVGFFNRTSRDSFFAIHLAHHLEVPPSAGPHSAVDAPLYHSGPPVLNYAGHGQLWSRWQLRQDPKLVAGLGLVQRNAYLLGEYPEDGGAASLEELAQRLLHPVAASSARGALPDDLGSPAGVTDRPLARPGERPVDQDRKRAIWEALREVRDEMFYTVDANVVDMGYVYDVRLRGDEVHVLMTMPHRGRPRYNWLANSMRRRLEQLPGVRSVVVDLTWEPAWTPNRLTDAGRRAMGLGEAVATT
ncbi:MAG: metal-sulfur cluster assembly factor [Chloroflexi bacterium]|nr:metal-sulfur cluster assembly factor [Chloroflexota bacterium]